MSDRPPTGKRTGHPIGRFTGIGRPLDLAYRSNRIAVAATVGAAVLVAVWQFARSGDQPLVWGLRAGGAAFLAWAIAREVDPDTPGSAAIAALLAVPALVAGAPGLLPSAAVLLAARIVLRSTGRPPTPLDLVAVVGLGAWAAATRAGWIAAVGLAGALILDALLSWPSRPARLEFGAAAVVAAVALLVAGLTDSLSGSWSVPTVGQVVVLALSAPGAVLLRAGTPHSMDDLDRHRLDAGRLRGAQLVAMVVAAVTVAWWWGGGIGLLGPVWAGLMGPAIVQRLHRVD